jgi:hypothetical protein
MNEKNEKSQPGLIPPHGGYRNLRSYQTAEIVYDATYSGILQSMHKHPFQDTRPDGAGCAKRQAEHRRGEHGLRHFQKDRTEADRGGPGES